MSYRVDLGVVTDEKGINTILASNAGKQLQDYGITVYQLDPDNRYHFMLTEVSYGWLVDIGLFETIESLEYYETLLVGEEIDDVEHKCVWPESMNNNPPMYYLTLKRECVLSCFVQYHNPAVAFNLLNNHIGAETSKLNAFAQFAQEHDTDEKHIKKMLDL